MSNSDVMIAHSTGLGDGIVDDDVVRVREATDLVALADVTPERISVTGRGEVDPAVRSIVMWERQFPR